MAYFCGTTTSAANGYAGNYGGGGGGGIGNGCGGPCGGTGRQDALQTSASNSKAMMQCLNDKLADYMRKMMELGGRGGPGGPGADSSQYHDLMRQMEAEINRLKQMYECELERLRRLFDEAVRAKTECTANSSKNDYALNDLRNKNNELDALNRRYADEIKCLQRAVADKEKEISDLMSCVKTLQSELDRLRPENTRLTRENEELRRCLEEERRRRQELESKLTGLTEKHSFDNQTSNQQVQDLQDRLRVASEIVCSLENQIRQLSGQGGNGGDMDGLLRKLRDCTMAELRRYKTETDDILNRNLDALRRQTDEDAREKEGMSRRIRELEECLRQLQARNADLEGQIQSLKQQNCDLLRELTDERARNEATIRELERKLGCLQEALMCRMREFNEARDVQATLNAEINNYKSMLDSECNRLASSSSKANSAPSNMKPPCYTPCFSSSGSVGRTQPRSASADCFTPRQQPVASRPVSTMPSGGQPCQEMLKSNSPYVSTRPAPFRPARPGGWTSSAPSANKKVSFSYPYTPSAENKDCPQNGKRAGLPYLSHCGTGSSSHKGRSYMFGAVNSVCLLDQEPFIARGPRGPSHCGVAWIDYTDGSAPAAGRSSTYMSGRRTFAC